MIRSTDQLDQNVIKMYKLIETDQYFRSEEMIVSLPVLFSRDKYIDPVVDQYRDEDVLEDVGLTWLAWMTVRSFMPEAPPFIGPLRPDPRSHLDRKNEEDVTCSTERDPGSHPLLQLAEVFRL